MKSQIAIIITVYSLNKNLLKVIKSIDSQIVKPNEVIVVTYKKFSLKNYKNLNLKIIKSSVSNQVYQRTLGLKYLSKSSKILLQLDDRIKLYKNSLLELNNFWKNAKKNIIGVGLNPKNYVEDQGILNFFSKKIGFTGKIIFGIYNIGYNNLNKNMEVDWLKGGLSSWKLEYVPLIFKRKFPKWKWCVGEDLEFSMNVKKNKKLIICSKSKAEFLRRNNYSKEQFHQRGYFSVLSKRRISNSFKKEFYFTISIYLIFNFFINIVSLRINKIYYNYGQLKALIDISFKKNFSLL